MQSKSTTARSAAGHQCETTHQIHFILPHPGTDLRIGHGLGPRAFWGPAQLLPIITHY